MIPNAKNFCGGAFPDWLEVNLTDKCNGTCSWCIERNGYHPAYHAPWQDIAQAALDTGCKNIILLGGEPTLYPDLKCLIESLAFCGCHVWMTTNGSLLTPAFVEAKLSNIYGINISIHHYDFRVNANITGIRIRHNNLWLAVKKLHENQTSVRLNCNCIKGAIDSVDKILAYIGFAKDLGADKVRFAELKQDDKDFVDLAKILDYKYGSNDNPFVHGCQSDCVINGMPVNFRQMCGLHTTRRVAPDNPEQVMKKVLYYDGKVYNGWQTAKGKETMEKEKLLELMQEVAAKTKTPEEAMEAMVAITDAKEKKLAVKIYQLSGLNIESFKELVSSGCCY